MMRAPTRVVMSKATVLSVDNQPSPAAASKKKAAERVTDSDHKGLTPAARAPGAATSAKKVDAHVHIESWIKNNLDRAKTKSKRGKKAGQKGKGKKGAADEPSASTEAAASPVKAEPLTIKVTSSGDVSILPRPAVARNSSNASSLSPAVPASRLTERAKADLVAYLRHIERSTVAVPTMPASLPDEFAAATGHNSSETGQNRRRKAQVRIFPISDPLGTVVSGREQALYPYPPPTFPVLPEALQFASDSLREIDFYRERNAGSGPEDPRVERLAAEIRELLEKARAPPALPPTPIPVSPSSLSMVSARADARDPDHELAERLMVAADLKEASLTVQAMTSGVVADIDALAKCQAVVGTCLSQVSRAIYELAYARGNVIVPPVGLDAESCVSLDFLQHPYAILAQWRGQVVLPTTAREETDKARKP